MNTNKQSIINLMSGRIMNTTNSKIVVSLKGILTPGSKHRIEEDYRERGC